jgi:hypothetical protein
MPPAVCTASWIRLSLPATQPTTSSAALVRAAPAPLPELPDAPNGLIAEPLPELVRELAARYDLQATTRRQAQAKKPLIRDKSRQHIKAGEWL